MVDRLLLRAPHCGGDPRASPLGCPPRDRGQAAPADAGEMLDLIPAPKGVACALALVGRLLEVVGCWVEFDDLHGVTR